MLWNILHQNEGKQKKATQNNQLQTVNSETGRIKGVSSFAGHVEGEKTPSPPLQKVHSCKV